MSKKAKCRYKLLLLNIFFISLCLIGLVPIFYTLILSISEGSAALTSSAGIIPKQITFENYRKIIEEEPFLQWLSNSALLSIGTMLLAMSTSVTAAYAFSRFAFRGKNAVLRMLLLLNAFPQILTMFAIFRLFKNINLLNSHMGLILIYAGSMCIFSIWNIY